MAWMVSRPRMGSAFGSLGQMLGTVEYAYNPSSELADTGRSPKLAGCQSSRIGELQAPCETLSQITRWKPTKEEV